ncbi:MAG: nuclear transport factor 2 family protein [Sciscionella sp.]
MQPDIEARIRRLEDTESIRRLKARYCDICDDGHNPARIVTLFAPEGTWETPEHGVRRGHAEIRCVFEGLRDRITFSQHNTTNLNITLRGDTATATWHFLGVLAFPDAPARLTLARYEETYVRLDGEWKILRLRAIPLARAELPGLTQL